MLNYQRVSQNMFFFFELEVSPTKIEFDQRWDHLGTNTIFCVDVGTRSKSAWATGQGDSDRPYKRIAYVKHGPSSKALLLLVRSWIDALWLKGVVVFVTVQWFIHAIPLENSGCLID